MGWFSPKPQATSAGPVPGTVDALAAALTPYVRWLRSLGGALPPRAMVLARVIGDHLEDVINDSNAHLDVQTLVTLERTVSAHVPDTVNAYLAARGTPEADSMLLEQLSTIEQVAAQSAQRSIDAARDAFAIQGTFLEEKFRHA